MRDRGDDSPKDLFGIRGFGAGEHDAAIPEAWFRCPPVKIEGADPGMDALRVGSPGDCVSPDHADSPAVPIRRVDEVRPESAEALEGCGAEIQ